MPFPELPLELLWAILSHLDSEDDYLSLCACALTCRALVSPAQAGIFRTISLSSKLLGLPTVLAKLESTPHIWTFIKRLRLREIHKPWIQHSKVLNRTLDLLSPYIVSLHIFQRRRKPENPRFNFSSLSQLTRLEDISLREEEMGALARVMYGNNALPNFLTQFPKLRAITFHQCLVENQIVDSKSDVATPVFRLETLHVQWCEDTVVLDWLIPALSSLRRLYFSYRASNTSNFRTTVLQFMITAGGSLQHLEVEDLNDASNADLRSLMTAVRTHSTNLRSLRLIITGSISEHSAIQVVVRSLLFIDAHTHLQHLTIVFYQHDAPVDGSPWDELQDLLLGKGFPALRSVEFRLLLNSPEAIPASTFVAAVPRLAQKKMISFLDADVVHPAHGNHGQKVFVDNRVIFPSKGYQAAVIDSSKYS
ncbi:hypothetical protein BDZ97DRAFT_2059810 [Flammula alnicola]|nr:hypothetical protein BDZ97DRAFT_2059810 [Flammula alnicola]